MASRAKDHDAVRVALERDGWTITHDPLTLKVGLHNLFVDLGAERMLAAERGSERIAVEIKSFLGPSEVADTQQALGQYLMYRMVSRSEPEPRQMVLAVPEEAWDGMFSTPLGQALVAEFAVWVLVFDAAAEVILRWQR